MIISAVVGAGFATGAELVTFFGSSALSPVVIALVVGVLLFGLMAALLFLPNTDKQWLFAPVFFIFFVAMTAGVTELAGAWASAIAVILSVLIVLFGFERMLTANKILMLFALIILLLVVISNFGGKLPVSNSSTSEWKTILSALLYASMNCCLLPAIFAEAKKKYSFKKLLYACFAAAITVGFFVLLILTAIRVNNVANAAMPVLALSGSYIIRFAILVCILTSMFAALFNLKTSNFLGHTLPQAPRKDVFMLVAVGSIGYGLSFLGFTKVIGIFYPIVGIAMIGFIVFSFCSNLKERCACRRIREH